MWANPPSFKLAFVESNGLPPMYRASPNRTNTESRSRSADLRRNPLDGDKGGNIPSPTMPQVGGPQGSSSRLHGADSVLWMRDITVLTGVNRSTITRWINRGEFPKKDAPYGKPNAWLRSTYERWLLGAVHVPTPGVDSVRP